MHNSFTFFNASSFDTSIEDSNNPFLKDSAGCPIIHHGMPIRKNDHIIIETDHGIIIRSEGETIHLDKVEKEEWPVMDELAKEDVSWWENFKRKFK